MQWIAFSYTKFGKERQIWESKNTKSWKGRNLTKGNVNYLTYSYSNKNKLKITRPTIMYNITLYYRTDRSCKHVYKFVFPFLPSFFCWPLSVIIKFSWKIEVRLLKQTTGIICKCLLVVSEAYLLVVRNATTTKFPWSLKRKKSY